jgi:hypothetical protein
VILVDNGSLDPCGQQVKSRYPEIELIVLPKNRGFTGGGNAGLRRAVDLGADYIQVYNNDILVESTTVSELVSAFERYPDVGVLTPMLLAPPKDDVTDLVQFYRGEVFRDIAVHEHQDVSGVRYGDREWPDVDSPFVPFCAPMFRRAVFVEVGYLDESLGTCWEDFDMCIRVADAGFRLMTVGSARIVHMHGQTTGRTSPYIVYYGTRNRLICLQRYANRRRLLTKILFLARSFWWQIRIYGKTSWSCHRAFLFAWMDFVLGRRGEVSHRLRRSD